MLTCGGGLARSLGFTLNNRLAAAITAETAAI
jgi:hypothetical protein